MNSVSLFSQALDPHRRAYILGAVTACVMTVGVFAQDLIAYLCVAIPAIVPLFLWMRAGALGMPVLPAISGLFFVYYAVPLLRSDIALYGSEELIGAAAMVGSFLVAASVASGEFATPVWTTVKETLLAFLLGSLLGMLTGVLLASVKPLKRSISRVPWARPGRVVVAWSCARRDATTARCPPIVHGLRPRERLQNTRGRPRWLRSGCAFLVREWSLHGTSSAPPRR